MIKFKKYADIVEKLGGSSLGHNFGIDFFYEQLHFRLSEPQIFENRINLVCNSRASNRKFKASFGPKIENFAQFCLFSLYLTLKWSKINKQRNEMSFHFMKWKSKILCWIIYTSFTQFFYKQPQFRVRPRVAMKFPKMRLKSAVFFSESRLKVPKFLTILVPNVRKKGKIRQYFRFEAQKLDFGFHDNCLEFPNFAITQKK